ncbi:farnesylcysteine lyase-like [Acanthaster planci]|uniref:Farnesylcysteine lyase-like n=1 Tax=Acanthaster planci TaxID=133434 RepID=A0A8B7ZUZ3_ACAPL|nr:farnesylcysteine lyase-like [Acanthaster planci]
MYTNLRREFFPMPRCIGDKNAASRPSASLALVELCCSQSSEMAVYFRRLKQSRSLHGHTLVVETDSTMSGSPHVVIVGAGMGGATCAYYLRKELPGVTVTVLEARDRVGGRTKDITFWGSTVNMGAALFNTEQRNIAALAKELNLKIHCFKRSGDFPDNTIWDGREIVQTGKLLSIEPEADAKMRQSLKEFLSALEATYQKYDNGTFRSIPEFLAAGGLEAYTRQSVEEFFCDTPVSKRVQKYVIETVMREFFGQGLESSVALAMICLAGVYQDAFKTEGGMSQLVKTLIESSGCNLHLNSSVSLVRKMEDQFEVWYSQREAEPKLKISADTIVIASPLEWAGIEFEGFIPAIVQPKREWERVYMYVSKVAAKSIRKSYFKGVSLSPDNPSCIYTTSDASQPWVALRSRDSSEGYNSYSIFHSEDIAEEGFLDQLFEGVRDFKSERWDYVHPVCPPVRGSDGYQSIILADGLYYLNGLESVASQMEIAVVSGRNIARLISKEL